MLSWITKITTLVCRNARGGDSVQTQTESNVSTRPICLAFGWEGLSLENSLLQRRHADIKACNACEASDKSLDRKRNRRMRGNPASAHNQTRLKCDEENRRRLCRYLDLFVSQFGQVTFCASLLFGHISRWVMGFHFGVDPFVRLLNQSTSISPHLEVNNAASCK